MRAKKRFEQENEAATRLYDRLGQANPDVTLNRVEYAGRTSEIVATRALTADIVVLGSAAAYDSQFWRDVYDGALIHSARPVLIAPPVKAAAERSTAAHGRAFASDVIIAWGGTAESARAFSAAVPFFANAEQVRIVTITSDPRKIELAREMAAFAGLHGASAVVKAIEPDHKHVARTLLDEAASRPGTLLVLGAYSHARWRERIFGGVTEHILHHSDVPVLMAH